MLETLVSVIVPVYNSEKYLNDCLESLVCQTYQTIEIILADDGSDDKSIEICEKWELKDSRIQLLRLKHEGVSNARNAGLSKANGKWVLFVDSDDYLKHDAIEGMVDSAEQLKFDLGIFDFYRVFEEKEKTDSFYVYDDIHFFDDEEKKELLSDCINNASFSSPGRSANSGVPWAKLYLRECIANKGINFPYGIKRMQDMLFNLQVIDEMTKIAYVPKSVYCYRYNDDSACTRYSPDFGVTVEQVLKSLKDYIEIKKYSFLEQDYHIKSIKLFLEWVRLSVVAANDKKVSEKIAEIRNRAEVVHLSDDFAYINYDKLNTPQKVGAFFSHMKWWCILYFYYFVGRAIR